MDKAHPIAGGAGGETVRFAVVGLGGSVLYYALGWLLVAAGVRPALASGSAFVCVVISNYVLHRRWTYRSDVAHARAMPAFLASAAVGLALSTCLVWFGVERLGQPYPWVQAVALGAVILFNLGANRRIFRPRRGPPTGARHDPANR